MWNLKNIKAFFSLSCFNAGSFKDKNAPDNRISIAGDHNSVVQNNNTIINTVNDQNHPIDQAKHWEELLKLFSQDEAVKTAERILDPRGKHYSDHNIMGEQKFIRNKFKCIIVNPKYETDFISILKKSSDALNTLAQTKNVQEFLATWEFCYNSLKTINFKKQGQ